MRKKYANVIVRILWKTCQHAVEDRNSLRQYQSNSTVCTMNLGWAGIRSYANDIARLSSLLSWFVCLFYKRRCKVGTLLQLLFVNVFGRASNSILCRQKREKSKVTNNNCRRTTTPFVLLLNFSLHLSQSTDRFNPIRSFSFVRTAFVNLKYDDGFLTRPPFVRFETDHRKRRLSFNDIL